MNFLTNINLSQNELQNAIIQPLSVAPSNGKQGQIYYNSSDKFIYMHDGTNWKIIGATYAKDNATGVVITGLTNTGDVNSTSVKDLTLDGYNAVAEGYVTTGMTMQEALAALDTAVKNAVAGGGEINQNAWSYINVTPNGASSATKISATDKTDTFAVTTTAPINVSADATNKKFTITHDTSGVTAGSYGANSTSTTEAKIPKITVNATGHTTSVATVDVTGSKYIRSLTSDAQTQINAKANSADIPTASATTPKRDGTAAVGTETTWARGDHVHPTDTTRQAIITGAASSVTSSDLTASRALISNGNGKIAVSSVTSTELGYIDGVTSNVQSQLNNLSTRIDDLDSIGRFLSYWDCTTGLAVTDPDTSPYTYKTGDYFVVSKVGTTNYRPTGSSYTIGTASTVVESNDVNPQDVYRYDGSAWALADNTPADLSGYVATFAQTFTTDQKTIARSNIGAGTSSFSGSYTDLTNKPTIPTIKLNNSSTTTPSFYAPTGAGTKGQVLTSNGSGAPTWQAAPESVHKYTATNSAIAASGGAYIWTINASTHGISNSAMYVALYEVSTGQQVMADITVNQSNYAITITIVGTGTLSAGTYRVVALG